MPEPYEQSEAARERTDIFTTLLAVALWTSLPMLGLLPAGKAALVGWSTAFFVTYFIPPRPQASFTRWMLERLLFIFTVYLAVYRIPQLLTQFLNVYLAYGIPFILLLIADIAWSRYPRSTLPPRWLSRRVNRILDRRLKPIA